MGRLNAKNAGPECPDLREKGRKELLTLGFCALQLLLEGEPGHEGESEEERQGTGLGNS